MIQRSLCLALILSSLSACSLGSLSSQPAKQTLMQNGITAQSVVKKIAKPAVISMISPNFNQRPDGTKINAIVLHHTAMASSAKRVGKFFMRPDAGVSSHYIVDRTGYIVQPVADKDRAWHAGRSTFHGVGNVNHYSIGIEICNLGDSKEPYPDHQYDGIIRLVAFLASEYKIPLSEITRHRDISIPPGRKIDTSNNFSVKRVLDGVRALQNGSYVPPSVQQPALPLPSVASTRTLRLDKHHTDFKDLADIVLDNEHRWKEIQYLNPTLRPDQLKAGTDVKIPTDTRFLEIAAKSIR